MPEEVPIYYCVCCEIHTFILWKSVSGKNILQKVQLYGTRERRILFSLHNKDVVGIF